MIWVYDGSFDGFLSTIFAVYKARDDLAQISRGGTDSTVQMGLFQEQRAVETDSQRARRVQNKIEDISPHFLRNVYSAWLSKHEGIDQALLSYIRLGIHIDTNPQDLRYHAYVREVLQAARDVDIDAYHYLQFIRFVRVGESIYMADIEPSYDILLMLCGQFVDRLAGMRFLIRDLTHRKTLIWNQQEFFLSEDPALLEPPLPQADEYARLWQTYFKHIAIPERINPTLQTKLVPKRYRKYMTEFAPTQPQLPK